MANNKVALDQAATSQDLWESALALLVILLVCGGLFYDVLFIAAAVVLCIFIFIKYGKKSKLKSKANIRSSRSRK
ncbi:TPA: hypothetical protein HA291_04730 [Candidatus Micrarchaeota archaeon]|jgi:hypothetical protein|nr:hypothetical protein [Candidatus Micrarchaeota archaeon]HII10214.1 hypothetical protein [Candidatus Micrarchaeota archaeon]